MYIKNKMFITGMGAFILSAAALWEGTRYYAYNDITGVPTVCQGYTGPDITFGRKYSAAECNVFLRKELNTHAEGMIKCVNVPLNENQFTAFTLFTYNVGVGAFCNASLTKKLNQGDYTGACDGLLAWTYAGGKKIKGLENRRNYERNLCLLPIEEPSFWRSLWPF